MIITLQSMALKNVKGVKEFSFTPSGSSALVAGDNGTGKTTIMDAYLWLLFDCDSSGRKGSEAIKTTAGTDFVHYLEHEVEATISVDGRAYTLRKNLEEKWTKPRGKAEQRFDGNVASYWINDVPKTLREYQDEINRWVPAGIFQLLTDPTYFSTQLHWKERLKILTEIAGVVSLEQIAGDNIRLQALVAELEAKDIGIDDYKKMIATQKSRLDDELKKIPVRIDESTRNRPEKQNWKELEQTLYWSKEQVSSFDKQLSSAVESLKPIIEAQQQLSALQLQREATLRDLATTANAKRTDMSQQLELTVSERRTAERSKALYDSELEDLRLRLSRKQSSADSLRREWSHAKGMHQAALRMIYAAPDVFADTCPTCGQNLPEAEIQQHLDQAKQAFDQDKAKQIESYKAELDRVTEDGKQAAAAIKAIEADIEAIEAQRAEVDQLIESLRADEAMIASVLAKPDYQLRMPNSFENDPEIQSIDHAIARLTIQINQTPGEATDDLLRKKQVAAETVERCQRLLRDKQTIEEADKRIAELEAELKEKAAMQVALEGKLQDFDDFVRAKTAAIEGNINSLFTQVGFKLFSEQVNGGVAETCEAIIGETTYGKANTAAQINAGLDIIETISEHMGIRVPVFVDRLESNLHLYPIKSQLIALQVAAQPLAVSEYALAMAL